MHKLTGTEDGGAHSLNTHRGGEGKHTRAGRDLKQEVELDTKIKQETEPKGGKNKCMRRDTTHSSRAVP